jgi:hypothetical protein
MYDEDEGIKIVIKIPSPMEELEGLMEKDYEEGGSEVQSIKSKADHYIKKFGCKRGK